MFDIEEIQFRIEGKNLYNRVYQALWFIDSALLATYPTHVLKDKEFFEECLKILISHFDSLDYNEHVQKGIDTYYTNNPNFEVNLTAIHYSCINNPDKFNLLEFYSKCFNDCFSKYFNYWEQKQLEYKRINAKKDRLLYLINNCHSFIIYARNNGLSDNLDIIQQAISVYHDRLSLLENNSCKRIPARPQNDDATL